MTSWPTFWRTLSVSTRESTVIFAGARTTSGSCAAREQASVSNSVRRVTVR
jgi:hypothetical protein